MSPLLLLLLTFVRSTLSNEEDVLDSMDPPRKFFIIRKKTILEESMERVQAFIVKDEDVTGNCRPPPKTSDIRCSQTRYLMCTGTILTNRYILTSADCVHEATYIRHNVRAPLAAMIDSYSKEAQVIKILDYIIHPKHAVDPRDDNHDLHNVAILKLACKITNRNVKQIELPNQSLGDLCGDESCTTLTVRQPSLRVFKMKQTKAKDIPMLRRKRSRVKRQNRNIGCTQTGTPVLSGRVQAGLVSMSCDNDQPDVTWHYTDLYNNVDFIKSVITSGTPGPGGPGGGGGSGGGPGSMCTMCIFNFFIGDINIGNKCLSESERSGLGCGRITAQQQAKNGYKSLKSNDPKQRYFDAINDMYKNTKYNYITNYQYVDNNVLDSYSPNITEESEDSLLKKLDLSKETDIKKYTDSDPYDRASDEDDFRHDEPRYPEDDSKTNVEEDESEEAEKVYTALYRKFLDDLYNK